MDDARRLSSRGSSLVSEPNRPTLGEPGRFSSWACTALIDVAMDVIGAERLDEFVRVEGVVDLRPHLRQAELDVFRFERLVDLVELGGALRVDEGHALEVTHEGLQQPAAC